MISTKFDVVIVGGGIAGLWAFNHLSKQGLKVVLFENQCLGAGQTVCSQGIIHGGLKYALTGVLNKDAKAMAEFPNYWKRCLGLTDSSSSRTDEFIKTKSGVSEFLDLSNTRVLADAQYLFSTGSLATGVSSFFASKLLHSAVAPVSKVEYPEIFNNPAFHGQLYKLAEIILDVPSLLKNLAEPFKQNIVKIDSCAVDYAEDGRVKSLQVEIAGENYSVSAQHYVFLAGEGNQALVAEQRHLPKIQRRPLHMVYLKASALPDLYAHCMDLSSNPRITITTHYAKDGRKVWYMGGNLAEEGVANSEVEQIAVAQKEIAALFPWFKPVDAEWGSITLNRAELHQLGGRKPTTATLDSYKNVHIGWPTKLVCAPLLAQKLSNKICAAKDTLSGRAGLKSQQIDLNKNLDLSRFPKPEIASYPWD